MSGFEGIWVPMVTPFKQGRLDIPAAQRLACRLRDDGISGLAVCATTGEAATLRASERRYLLDAVQDALEGSLPVLFGLAGSDTAALCEEAQALDADARLAGLLVSAPAYMRPPQEGVRRHFEAIAAATRHDIVLYNIPYRTGVEIEPATCRALAGHPRIKAIKQSHGERLGRLAELIETTPLKVLSGEDSLVYANACMGGHGAIAAGAHIEPALWVRMLRLVGQGDLHGARAIQRALMPMVKLLFSEPNPAPLKAVLAMQGLLRDEVRLPHLPASTGLRVQLAAELEKLSGLAGALLRQPA